MFVAFVLFAFLVSYQKVSAQTIVDHHDTHAHVPVHRPVVHRYNDHIDGPPKPYSYSYQSPLDGGALSQQEVADGSGQVRGSYSLSDEDGRSRLVEYYADETGFHANIKTNEPGTANQNPADVQIESSAPTHVDTAHTHAVAPVVHAARRPVRVYNRARPVDGIHHGIASNHYYPSDSHYYDQHHHNQGYYYGQNRHHLPYYY